MTHFLIDYLVHSFTAQGGEIVFMSDRQPSHTKEEASAESEAQEETSKLDQESIDLLQLLRIIRKRFWIIILTKHSLHLVWRLPIPFTW